jgi:hypothetical protein
MLDSRNQGPEWHGKVQQGNSGDVPLVRIGEAPLVTNVHIVPADADTPPSGVGEPGVPPFAPAWSRDLRSNRKTHPDPADRQAT